MNILHIHQDYPDGRPYPITKAVSNLIKGCEEVDKSIKHTVLSINRTSNPLKVAIQPFEQGISVIYWAIPLPILYYWSMKISALLMYRHVKNLNLHAIHGHKLTCEGVFAYYLSKKLNIPYVLSVRGGSDMHNINRLSLHKSFFAKVFNNAKKVFWISAWAKKPIQNSLLIENSKITDTSLLPNICNIDLAYPQKSPENRNGYVTAVSYHQHKRKGVAELIEAISLLNKKNPSIELNIYGTGDDIYKTEIENLILKYNAGGFIHLKGQVNQAELLEAMSLSKGFLLPAVNETFGMAYIEALSVGCPILYVENTGIDGYFDKVSVGEKISTLNVPELVLCLEKIDNNNAKLCNKIKELQFNDNLSFYTSPCISQQYINIIKRGIHV